MNNPNIQIETPPAKTRAKSQNLEGKIQAKILLFRFIFVPL